MHSPVNLLGTSLQFAQVHFSKARKSHALNKIEDPSEIEKSRCESKHCGCPEGVARTKLVRRGAEQVGSVLKFSSVMHSALTEDECQDLEHLINNEKGRSPDYVKKISVLH